MDIIWKNAAKKMCTHEKCAASCITTMPAIAVKTPPVALPTAFDPKTGTLEELERTSQRLQWDWPKEDGIPFLPNILETLMALRVAVIARDARKRPVTVQTLEQPASAESTLANAETVSKNAGKKRCFSEKHATANTTALPTVAVNPPTAVTIVLNAPVTADCSPTQIGANTTTATP
jgi:hypothetical protein